MARLPGSVMTSNDQILKRHGKIWKNIEKHGVRHVFTCKVTCSVTRTPKSEYLNPFTPKSDQLQFSLSVSHGEFGNR